MEKVNFENAVASTGADGSITKTKHAIPSENAFRLTKAAAEMKGMKVNCGKTHVLCVSDSLKYTAKAYIEDASGEIIGSRSPGRLKVLGFHFCDKPTVKLHVESIRRKFRQRFWSLYHLWRNGFTQEELVRVYKSSVRPVADYCDTVYHSMLTDEMDEELDRLQNHALRIIFGFGIGGRRLRELAGVTTLRERRVQHCDAFAAKCLKSDRFKIWFPLKQGRRSTRIRDSERSEKFLETFARCDRLRDSPVFFFRRRLNGKAGKKYGERYREFREDS